MKVKLKNSTGGSISVDIEMNDTPKEIIAKAIQQNEQSDVAVIFACDDFVRYVAESTKCIDTNVSNFSLETREGFVLLDWDIPVGEQVMTQIGQIINKGYEVRFFTVVTIPVW